MLCRLHINELAVVRNCHHHPVTVHIAHGSSKREILNLVLVVHTEEDHRTPELEVVLYLVVVPLTVNLYHQLVQRVVIALSHLQRIPGITALHLPLQPHLLGLFVKGLLLSGILHLEKQPLLRQFLYRSCHNCAQNYYIFCELPKKTVTLQPE